MSTVTLPDRWILDRYMRMLHRVLRAARAHAKHSHPFVVQRLTESIELEAPDPHSAAASAIQVYLQAIGRTVVETRYPCNEPFDQDDKPYRLISGDEPGSAMLVFPGCEVAMSLLDAVDDNVPEMLVRWGQDFWCRPRDLYDRLRRHEIEHESGLARFTGFLDPVEVLAPSKWACDF